MNAHKAENDVMADCPTCGGEGVIYPTTAPAKPEIEPTDERLVRALLTLAAVESAVQKIERYLETNGRCLPIDAVVPMRAQTEAMRNALNSWKADR